MNTGPMDEATVENFLVKFKAADNDKKVDLIQFFGLQLETATSLPETTLDAITLLVSPSLKSNSHLLIQSTLTSFLPFFLPHIPTSPSTPSTHSHIRLLLVQLLPHLLEKLNDPKEKIHTAARDCIILLGKKCYEAEPVPLAPFGSANGKGKEKEGLVSVWERNVRDVLGGKGWRGKVEGMKLLLIMRGEKGSRLTLKPWLATLVDLLEDGDGNVRDQARETVVALLSPASTPPGARSELKKLLASRQVRKTIADNIITRVFSGGTTAAVQPAEIPLPADDAASDGLRSGAATPAPGAAAANSSTNPGDEISIVYIASGRDLEHEFAQMIPYFQGKEDEHNWNPREKSVVRVRGMLRGQAFQHYPEAFVAGLKAGFMDGLSRTLVSLRTTVAQQSCALMQELAEHLGSAIDPFVENLLPVLGKMAGYTKRIIADKSQKALAAIITHSTASPRLFISHIHAGIHEKNIQTRHACTIHLKTFLDIQAPKHRSSIENGQSLLDLLAEATQKGLSDVNPGVREVARTAFWSFHDIWPTRAAKIADHLDATARKQLDKANPRAGSASTESSKPAKAAVTKKPSTAVQAMMAEKRRALAAGRMAQETQRTVSSPVPNSPSIPQGMPRSTSSTSMTNSPLPARRTAPLARSTTSPATSPRSSPKAVMKSTVPPTRDLSPRSRSPSLGKSPSSSKGSPPSRSPLRQSNTFPATTGQVSPASSSATSGAQALRTPTLNRKPLPGFNEKPVGIGIYISTNEKDGEIQPDGDLNLTPSRPHLRADEAVIHEVQAATAAQGVSSAQQLLELNDDIVDSPIAPVTPARPHHQNDGSPLLYKTPISLNGLGRNVWEDSPGVGAVTPKMVDRLKERRYERSWWLKRQQYLDKASPLRTSAPTSASAIEPDIEALVSGTPEMRNLQKLTLFSTSHPISAGEDEEDDKVVWEEGKVFDRIFDGLLAFLQPERATDILEQGLVLLWELVQHQYIMFEGKEMVLVDALFRLRTCRSTTILESTNSLISLLTETSDPVYFLGIVRSSLHKYITSHSDGPGSSSSAPDVSSLRLSTDTPTKANGSHPPGLTGEKARASGYLFGLNAIGMCVLRLPEAVVEVEGGKLAEVIMDALSSSVVSARQAAHMLLLAIQCVLHDAQKSLSLVPGLNAGQKNLAMYLMESNGLLGVPVSPAQQNGHGHGLGFGTPGRDSIDGERKERVVEEMVGLLSRGVA